MDNMPEDREEDSEMVELGDASEATKGNPFGWALDGGYHGRIFA